MIPNSLVNKLILLSLPSPLVVIQSILHLWSIPSNAKHLGLPIFFHRNKSLAFKDLNIKILNRLSGWKASFIHKHHVLLLSRRWKMQCVATQSPYFSFPRLCVKILIPLLGKSGGGFL